MLCQHQNAPWHNGPSKNSCRTEQEHFYNVRAGKDTCILTATVAGAFITRMHPWCDISDYSGASIMCYPVHVITTML